MSVTFARTADVAAAIDGGREITVSAYTLHRGSVLAALERAGDRGAHVHVVLERAPVDGTNGGPGGTQAQNAGSLAALRAHHVDAVTTAPGEPMLHAKSAVVDGVAFLDDRNFPDSGANTVVRDDRARDVAAVANGTPSATLATTKRGALAMEATVVGRGDDVVVETESFGGSAVSKTLRAMAQSGHPPRMRVVVAASEFRTNAKERELLASLAAAGVDVRVGAADEKMAVAGSHAWLGSTNATAAYYDKVHHHDLGAQRDWGMAIDDPPMVAELRKRFEANWHAAKPLASALRELV
jgi:phosphatidylserine/phosphatidylglycerophosphate/cardiolipin synthase-like enzyme